MAWLLFVKTFEAAFRDRGLLGLLLPPLLLSLIVLGPIAVRRWLPWPGFGRGATMGAIVTLLILIAWVNGYLTWMGMAIVLARPGSQRGVPGRALRAVPG